MDQMGMPDRIQKPDSVLDRLEGLETERNLLRRALGEIARVSGDDAVRAIANSALTGNVVIPTPRLEGGNTVVAVDFAHGADL